MSFLPRLVCSQSAPNLFFDWTDLERKLVFEQERIEEGNKIEKKKTGYLQNINFNFSKQRESQVSPTMMYVPTKNHRKLRLNSDPQIWSATKWPSDLQLITQTDAGGPVQPVRPVAIGSTLVGLSISCFLYLLPSLVCATTYHAFLATVFLMASFFVPFITSILMTNSRNICCANIVSLLCLIFISSIHFVPNFFAPFTYALLGPLLATLDTGSLNLVFTFNNQRSSCPLHSNQQQQQKYNLLIAKYLTFYKGWGNLFAGAIFGLVLLLSQLNQSQTFHQLYHSSSLSQQSYNLTPRENVLILQSSNLTVQQNKSQISDFKNVLSESSESYKIKLSNQMSIEDLPKEMLHHSNSSSNILSQNNNGQKNEEIVEPIPNLLNWSQKRFKAQKQCPDVKSSFLEIEYCKETLWKSVVVIMSIIFASAMLMYLMVLLIYPTSTSTTDERIERFLEGKKMHSRKCVGRRMRKTIDLYQTEIRLHALTLLSFFIGLHEAFMAKNFVHGMVHQVLGLEFVCLVISLMGLARIISTWVSSHSAVIGPSYLVIVLSTLFQCGLFVIFFNWVPSVDDQGMFFATTFTWGTTSAAWDFIILSRAKFFYGLHWNSATSILNFYKYFGMAVMFSLDSQLTDAAKRIYLLMACLALAVMSIACLEKQFLRSGKKTS